jgi:hypothetical protein
MAVMHDFVAHIDRRAEFHQSALDDVDGALHPGAKPAGLGEDDADGFAGGVGGLRAVH